VSIKIKIIVLDYNPLNKVRSHKIRYTEINKRMYASLKRIRMKYLLTKYLLTTKGKRNFNMKRPDKHHLN